MPHPTTPEDRQLRLRVAISNMVSRHAESVHQATIAAMTDRDRDCRRHNRAARRQYRAILRLTRMLAETRRTVNPRTAAAYDEVVRIVERQRGES